MAWTWASKMVDPIAYRAEEQGNITPNTDLKADWTYDPAKLKNPDDSLNMYWDDSSEANYKNPATVWGRAEKYTWEWVKTSDVEYNPDITTKDLNPDYLYGREAQMYGSENNWYISERNDNIASALYNEWRVSKQDVANFLNQQKWFQNSTEEERLNTIESVWKRLWKVAWDGTENENKTDWNTEWDNSALNNMEDDLLKDTTGKLYGKNTADDNDIIKTLQDSNSVERRMAESRIKNFKQLQSTSSDALAAAIVSWAMATDTQAMTDLMQYDPAKYQEVQDQIKVIRWQMNITAISTWEWDLVTSATNWQSSINNEKADFVSDNASWTKASELLQSVNSSLNSNVAASTASEQMANLEADMAALQNRMKGLKWEARKLFKWDVPQYIVNAYVANRTQEIQDQLSQLESRYNMAYSRYQQEWEQTKWTAEFGLKQDELNLKLKNYELDAYIKKQWLDLQQKQFMIDNWLRDPSAAQTTSLSREEVYGAVDDLISCFENWQLGKAQCAAGIQKYYLPYLWVNLWTLSKWSEKQGICNELAASWYIPQKWDLVVMQGSKPEYWHIGIVIWVDEQTWTMKYLDWNGSLWADGNWTETPQIRTKPINNTSVYGYYNPTKSSGSGTQSSSIWSFTRKDWASIATAWTRYDKLNDDERRTVEWLINRQINPASLNTRYWEKKWSLLKSIASELDPNYTDWAFATANKTRDAWSTSSSKGSNSRNWTAVATAKELYDMSDKIWNTKFKDWNSMINFFKWKLSDAEYIKFVAWLNTLAFEYAGALKWWASPTEQDVRDAKQYITADLWGNATKETAKTLTQMLYNKNVNEAQNYFTYTYELAPSIWDRDVEQWMMNTVWIDLTKDYTLKSKPTWWGVVQEVNAWISLNKNASAWVGANLTPDQMTANIFS